MLGNLNSPLESSFNTPQKPKRPSQNQMFNEEFSEFNLPDLPPYYLKTKIENGMLDKG